MIDIQATTTKPEHTEDGYWNYEMALEVNEQTYEINCWKLATFLERGASQDIDGSGLALWGDSQPGGWRVLDFDSQGKGKPSVDESTEEGYVTVWNDSETIEIQIPSGEDLADFIEALQRKIDEAAANADPEEPDAEAIWQDLSSFYEMDYQPVRVGRVFGSKEVFVVWMDGHVFEVDKADKENPPEQMVRAILKQFKEEFERAVERAEEN